MTERETTYRSDDATLWRVVNDDGSVVWETKVGAQVVLRFATEEDAIEHLRRWEGQAAHERSYGDRWSSRPTRLR